MKTILMVLVTLTANASMAALVATGQYDVVGTWSDLNGHGGEAILKWTQNGPVGVNEGILVDSNTSGPSKYPNMAFNYTYRFVSPQANSLNYNVDLKQADGGFSTVGLMIATATDYRSELVQADPTSASGGRMTISEQGHYSASSLSRSGTISLQNGNVIFYQGVGAKRVELKQNR